MCLCFLRYRFMYFFWLFWFSLFHHEQEVWTITCCMHSNIRFCGGGGGEGIEYGVHGYYPLNLSETCFAFLKPQWAIYLYISAIESTQVNLFASFILVISVMEIDLHGNTGIAPTIPPFLEDGLW